MFYTNKQLNEGSFDLFWIEAIFILKNYPTFSIFSFLCSLLFPTLKQLSFPCVSMQGKVQIKVTNYKKSEATAVGSTVKLSICKVHYITVIFSAAAVKNRFQTPLHKILCEYTVKESFYFRNLINSDQPTRDISGNSPTNCIYLHVDLGLICNLHYNGCNSDIHLQKVQKAFVSTVKTKQKIKQQRIFSLSDFGQLI